MAGTLWTVVANTNADEHKIDDNIPIRWLVQQCKQLLPQNLHGGRTGDPYAPCTFPVPSLYLPCTFPVPSTEPARRQDGRPVRALSRNHICSRTVSPFRTCRRTFHRIRDPPFRYGVMFGECAHGGGHASVLKFGDARLCTRKVVADMFPVPSL